MATTTAAFEAQGGKKPPLHAGPGPQRGQGKKNPQILS